MRLLALLGSVLVACGGGAAKTVAKPTQDPIPTTAGPSCKEVATQLATLAERDPSKDAKTNESLRGRCESDRWNDEARSCFATATSDAEVDGCKTKLTAQQQTAFSPQGQPAAAEPAPPPKDAGKKKTRGYAPKDKGKDGDPCEGGQ